MPDEKLEQIRTFTSQDVLAHPGVDFQAARLQEHQAERQTLIIKKKHDEEEWIVREQQIKPVIEWRAPPSKRLCVKKYYTIIIH